MRLANTEMLWLMVTLVPALILFFWWAWRKRQQLVTQFISARLLGHLKVGFSPSRQKLRMVLLVLAVVFVVLALARPQWGMSKEEARQRGLDIVVAIDTSNSMLAQDTAPNRLARAKLAALDLMRRAKTDRLGLVAFAGAAFLQCPLTLDDGAFSQSVNGLDTSTISQGGTAIGEAIDEARKAFKEESDNHKVLVLFTDGEDHDSDAVAEAEKAAKEGMIIFTIGIGTPEGEQIHLRDERGRVTDLLDENGKPVVSHLNEELLQHIATVTKGFYLPLRGTKTIDTLYDRGLAPLPKSENSVRMFQRFHEQYHWPLAIAMLLLIVETFLPDRGGRRRSRMAARPANAATVVETTMILFLLALPLAARAGSSSALREYNDGKYQDSLKEYNRLLDRKKDDPRLHFNAGDAAYQAHQLEQASKEFNEALTSPDLQMQQRAYYNLGNTLYRLGEQMPDAEKKQEAWENSMKSFENALKLNQQDADANYNHEFVKKQIEELKKQQQQQQSQPNKNSKQNKKNQQNQNQQNQDQQQQNQQDKDQQNQQQNQQNAQDNRAQQKSEQEKQQEQQQRDQQSQGDKQKSDAEKQREQAEKQQQQAAAGSGNDKPSAEEAEREAAMMAAGQMTPRQAEQLLDSHKDEEKVFQIAPPNKIVSQGRNFKNW